MQSVPGLPPADPDVVEPNAVVTVAGRTYGLDRLESVTVERELASALPAQVTAASGLTAASGSVSWLPAEDSTAADRHPWAPESIVPGDPVTVEMGFGSALARQLTGVVDSDAGSLRSGSETEFVDLIDKLNTTVSLDAHLSTMPPWEDGGAFLPANNLPTYTTDRVLRACGFYATPPVAPSCVLSLPLMGSAWPEIGTVTRVSQAGTGNSSFAPSFVSTSWGMGVDSISAAYTPDGSRAGNDLRLNRTVSISVKMSGPGSASSFYVRAQWGTHWIQLLVNNAKVTAAQYYLGSGGGIQACSIGSVQNTGASLVTMRVDSAGAVTMFNDKGFTATGTVPLTDTMKTTAMSSISLASPHQTGVTFGGVQVAFSAYDYHLQPETARLTAAAYRYSLPAMRRFVSVNALDILKAQAEAECASMWIDEFGVFRWVNRDEAIASAPVATLTALDNVFDVSWESTAAGVRRRAVCRMDEPFINRSDVSNKNLWQGSGESLEINQTMIEFAEPADDEDWVGVDERFTRVLSTTRWPGEFNRGIGSWEGGIDTNDTSERWATTLNSVVEKIAPYVYKITHTAGNPGTGYTVELRTPAGTASTAIRTSKRDFNLPIVRGKVRVEWRDHYVAGGELGPVGAGDLSHDVGPWIQDVAGLQVLADWLSGQVAAPRPLLRDLDVVPDPRRQLGDVVWIEDSEVTRVRWKVMLTKISTTVSAGSMEQSVGGHILAVEPLGVTNAELDEHADGYSNAEFDTLWAGGTNAGLDAEPLERG